MKSVVLKRLGVILAVCALALTTPGCQMLGLNDGRSVKFAAASNLVTKAIYGDDVDNGDAYYQQIKWEQGDEIRIASNHAWTEDQHYFANYNVSRAGERGKNSYGTLSTTDGLRWTEDWTYAYDFWAMYPASSATSLEQFTFDGTFSATIPGADYLMVAHTSASYGQSKIVLEFYPAFTAFRIDIKSDVEGVTINNLSLLSTSHALSGEFTARIVDEGITDFQEGANTSMTATSTLVEDKEGGVRSFVIFCLPNTLSHLTLQCDYTQNGEQKSKKLKLMDSNENWMVFSPCKQHRMDLTLNASEGGDIHFNLTIGGCQMILSILADQLTQWGGEGMRIAMQKYGMDPDDQSQWWNGQHQDFWDWWNGSNGSMGFCNKPINYFNQFVSNVDKTNPPDCRVVFGEPYFNNTELEIIREFLQTVTYYSHKTTLSESIVASDFLLIPNLKEIRQEEIDEGTIRVHNDVSIEIDGMSSLQKIDLHKWPNVTVKNCPSLTEMKVTNTTTVPTYVNVDSCPALTQFTADGSGPEIHYSFSNMPALTVLNLNDAGSLTVSNCPAFREFNFWTANHLTAISLSNTPVFQTGKTYNTAQTVSISLNNCSASQPGATIDLRGNGDAVNAGKVNSNNVTVTFYGGDGQVKTQF